MREAVRVADHMSADEIKMRLQMAGGFFRAQKWLVIYNAIVDPRPVSEIAKHIALSEGTVHRIIAEYNSLGPESWEDRTKSGSSWRRTAERLRNAII